MYELIENELGMQTIKLTLNDGSVFWISNDPENPDYQAYLAKQEK